MLFVFGGGLGSAQVGFVSVQASNRGIVSVSHDYFMLENGVF